MKSSASEPGLRVHEPSRHTTIQNSREYPPGYSLTFTCTHLPSLVLTYLNFYSLSFTCTHLPSLVLTYLHSYSLTFPCTHLPSLVLTFLNSYSRSFTGTPPYLPSLIRIFFHLYKNLTYSHLPSLIRNNNNNNNSNRSIFRQTLKLRSFIIK